MEKCQGGNYRQTARFVVKVIDITVAGALARTDAQLHLLQTVNGIKFITLRMSRGLSNLKLAPWNCFNVFFKRCSHGATFYADISIEPGTRNTSTTLSAVEDNRPPQRLSFALISLKGNLKVLDVDAAESNRKNGPLDVDTQKRHSKIVRKLDRRLVSHESWWNASTYIFSKNVWRYL